MFKDYPNNAILADALHHRPPLELLAKQSQEIEVMTKLLEPKECSILKSKGVENHFFPASKLPDKGADH
jgi:hypothetical protein